MLSPNLLGPIGLVTFCGLGFAFLWRAFLWVNERDKIGIVAGRLLGYAVLLGIVAAYGAFSTIYLLARYRRLVIGKDRLQLLAPSGRVIGQIPYSNIGVLEIGQHLVMHSDRVQIILRKRRHRGTWWPGMARPSAEYDVTIKGSYEVDATHLRLLLRDAMVRGGYA